MKHEEAEFYDFIASEMRGKSRIEFSILEPLSICK
jgi:hypothetical protein